MDNGKDFWIVFNECNGTNAPEEEVLKIINEIKDKSISEGDKILNTFIFKFKGVSV